MSLYTVTMWCKLTVCLFHIQRVQYRNSLNASMTYLTIVHSSSVVNSGRYSLYFGFWIHLRVVLATGPGNPPAVQVWTAKTGRFGSRTGQKPDPQTIGGPNPDPYPSTRRFRRVWLDPSVPISSSAFRVSHLWSHSGMRLLIVKYWP